MTSGRTFRIIFILAMLIWQIPANAASADRINATPQPVPILLYHRFGPTLADSMTVTNPVFLSHLEYLKANGYTVIPLRQVVDGMLRNQPAPVRSVAIVVDDGHKSVYTDMLPLVRNTRFR